MFRNRDWRIVFIAGALCGIALTGAASIWWNRAPQRPPQDSAIYDNCLMAQHGNQVACDALMRQLNRERAAEAVMKQQAAKLLAAAFSKREVVKWATDQGFVGEQLSNAVGISLQDLQAGKY
jgi:hypothetical protein